MFYFFETAIYIISTFFFVLLPQPACVCVWLCTKIHCHITKHTCVSVHPQIIFKYFIKSRYNILHQEHRSGTNGVQVWMENRELIKSNFLLLQEFTAGNLFTYKLLCFPIHEDIIPESYYCYKKCRSLSFQVWKEFLRIKNNRHFSC